MVLLQTAAIKWRRFLGPANIRDIVGETLINLSSG